MIEYLLPQRAATVQTLGHPAAGVLGWYDPNTNASGVSVNADTALTYAAFWCGVRVICETVGTLPCLLYERKANNTRDRADTDDRYWLMSEQPHPLMNAGTFFESQTGHCVVQGNSFSRIVETQGGAIDRLEPRMPDETRFKVNGDTIDYECDNPNEKLTAGEMLHVPGMGSDGIQGWSVVTLARQSLGSALAGDTYSAAQMGNGATPKGVLKFPTRLDENARNKFREDWEKQHGGSGNAGRIAILHGGMEYQAISMSNEDAQFLQSRQFSVREIARWLRLPPHMLADLADSSVRANIEQQAIEFITYSLKPWLVRWEQTLNRKLLSRDERRKLYFEFLTESLLQGDKAAQANFWMLGRQWGWWSVNDIRRQMNQPPIPGGDVYLQPSNMVPADSDMAKGEKPDPPAPPVFNPPADNDEKEVPDSLREEQQRNFAQRLNAILDEGKQLHQAVASGCVAISDAVAASNATLQNEIKTLRADQQEIRRDLAAPRHVQVQGWEAGKEAFLGACDDLFQSHMRCCLRMEQAEVLKAVRCTVQRGQNFLEWLAWYDDFEELVVSRIDDTVECFSKVSDSMPARDFAADYCARHRESLLAAADGDPATFEVRVRATLCIWTDEIDKLTLRGMSHAI